jgi:hypothetical protein
LPDGNYDVDAVRSALDRNVSLAKSPIWRRHRDAAEPVDAEFYAGLWRTPEEAAAMRRRRGKDK